MKAKIYVGAKKYALYIGRKIVEKTLEFLTLPARFVSKKVQDLKNLTMWGQSVQNGTPTPTAPVEIESVGDKTINLANQNATINYPYTYYGYNIDVSVYSLQIKLKEGKSIPAGAYFGIVRRDANGRNSAKWVLTNGALTNNGFITTSESEISLYTNYGLACYPSNKATWDTIFDAFDIMLVKGIYIPQTMPPYEPYGYKVPVTVGNTTTNIYLNEPLRKIGEYADTMSVDGTEVTVVRNIKKHIPTSVTIGSTNLYTYYENLKDIASVIVANSIYSEVFKQKYPYASYSTMTQGELMFNPTNTNIYYKNDNITTISEFLNWIKDYGVYYPLATPTTETYTIENAIQLEQGTLTIDTDTNIKPSKISITGDIDNE